jgi:hypothetical protein
VSRKPATFAGIGLLLALGLAPGQPVRAQAAGLLAAPGDYSFAPAPVPGPAGVASVAIGSRHMQSSSIRMDSGLLGGSGTRAFVAMGEGQGPDLQDAAGKARIVSHGMAVGLEKSFADGARISIEGGWQRDRLMTTGRPPVYATGGLP